MGCGASSSPIEAKDCKTVWKIILKEEDAYEKYSEDRTIPECCDENLLELRALLDDDISIDYLVKFESSINRGRSDLMNAWKDIESYHNSFQLKGKTILAKYKQYSKLFFGQLDEYGLGFNTLTEGLNSHTSQLDIEECAFKASQCLRYCCVQIIFYNLYLDFMKNPGYSQMCHEMKFAYNKVDISDFSFSGKMAEGGYGLILCGKKETTGVTYALKCQTKASLLAHCGEKPERVLVEMQAHSLLDHPYIACVDYAFHTEILTILAIPLATCGDLYRSLCGRTMSADRVQFYAAEIVSALLYLHENGFIYRDLKPSNILLTGEGHIMLADLGSVIDINDFLGISSGFVTESKHHIFAKELSYSNSANVNTHLDNEVSASGVRHGNSLNFARGHGSRGGSFARNRHGALSGPRASQYASACTPPMSNTTMIASRAESLVGTLDYMAPEILKYFDQKPRGERKEYDSKVDWFSLGVTLYKLLFGFEPYCTVTPDFLISSLSPSVFVQQQASKPRTLKDIFEPILGVASYDRVDYLEPLLPGCELFLTGLLEINPTDRIGDQDVKNMAYFKGIDWDLIEKKEFIPPYYPLYEQLSVLKKKHNKDFDTMLINCGKSKWMEVKVDPQKKKETKSKILARNEENDENYCVYDDDVVHNKYIIKKQDQRYFRDWKFVSNKAVKLEMSCE